ncbi:hypothetical protein FACS1894199_18280 [Bacteroidia bacterium]|nr:hypothetical protein FACS1894199_18280 [Bacteroidia bacterium]
MKNLIYLLVFLSFVGCKQTVQKGVAVTTVEAFPATIELKAGILNVPPVILAPANMFIYDNQLVIMYNKKPTVFDFFQLPECQYLYSSGMRGGGPSDLPVHFDSKFTRATSNGFSVFSPSGLIREYRVDRVNGGKLINCKDQKINLQHLGDLINGFNMLSDSVFIAWPSVFNHQGYEFVHINANTNENTLFSAMPQWVDAEWCKDAQQYFAYFKNTVVHPSENKFAAFYAFFKQWRIYDNMELIHDISVHIPPYSAKVGEDVAERMTYYDRSYASEKYIYAICRNKKYTDDSSLTTELQVWKWDGTPVAVLLLDKKIACFTISEKDNKIYAVTSDEGYEDTIYVYSIPEVVRQ